MDWLRLTAVLVLALFLISGFLLMAVLMVRFWSSRARETWAPRYTTIDRLQMKANMVASEGRAEGQHQSPQSWIEGTVLEASTIRADIVTPYSSFVIPVSFVAKARNGIAEIQSKVPTLLVISWVWPVLFVPVLPFCVIYLAGPQRHAFIAAIMMTFGIPVSSWFSFRSIRAKSRDLRKATLGV